MIGIIIALSIVGIFAISATVYSIMRLNRLETQLATLAECTLLYMSNPDKIDVIKETELSHSDFNFPNTEGGFQ